MGIFRNNEPGKAVLQTSRGTKTAVKRGRLGSGAMWPKGVPIQGNIWGSNNDIPQTNPIPANRPFGTPGNVGNFTRADEGRLGGADLPHPNAGFNRTSLQNFVPPMTKDGDGTYRTPFGANPVIQPHEKNSLHHRKVYGTYRTAFGASRTLPSDTAFQRIHPKEKPKPVPTPQTYVTKIQNTSNPVWTPRGQGIPSFVSRNQLWYDANQSFLQGAHQPVGSGSGVGRGRWSTVKKGAAG